MDPNDAMVKSKDDPVDWRNPVNHLGCINPNYQPQLVQDFFHQQETYQKRQLGYVPGDGHPTLNDGNP